MDDRRLLVIALVALCVGGAMGCGQPTMIEAPSAPTDTPALPTLGEGEGEGESGGEGEGEGESWAKSTSRVA